MRMVARRAIATMAVMAMLLGAAAAAAAAPAADFVEGRHYTRVSVPQPTESADKIEVRELSR